MKSLKVLLEESGLDARLDPISADEQYPTYDVFEQTHMVLRNEYGAAAAANMVRMVADSPTRYTAADFRIGLYTLESSRWQWSSARSRLMDQSSTNRSFVKSAKNFGSALLEGLAAVVDATKHSALYVDPQADRIRFLAYHNNEILPPATDHN